MKGPDKDNDKNWEMRIGLKKLPTEMKMTFYAKPGKWNWNWKWTLILPLVLNLVMIVTYIQLQYAGTWEKLKNANENDLETAKLRKDKIAPEKCESTKERRKPRQYRQLTFWNAICQSKETPSETAFAKLTNWNWNLDMKLPTEWICLPEHQENRRNSTPSPSYHLIHMNL